MPRSTDLRTVLKKVTADRPRAAAAKKRAGSRAAAAASRPVVFSCDNEGLVVGITAKTVSFVFIGTGGASLHAGRYLLFYRVRGNGGDDFTITASGAVMEPIVDRIPAGKKSTGGNNAIEV